MISSLLAWVAVAAWAIEPAASAPIPVPGHAEPVAREVVAPPTTSDKQVDPTVVPPATAQAWRDTLQAPLPSRIDAISKTLIGAPYVHSPAGEGSGHDPDPLTRYDAFDCLTFVEQVMVLALSPTLEDAPTALTRLRYGESPVDYNHRHHFMETQWLPAAVHDGWLRDTTATYGEVIHQQRVLDADDYSAWRGRTDLALPDEVLPKGAMTLDVLPLDTARAVSASFRPGSIMLVVRADRANTPLWITHLGWILGDGTTFRHASQMSSSMRVRDHNLSWYLGYLATWKNWPVVGVAIFEPIDVPRALAP